MKTFNLINLPLSLLLFGGFSTKAQTSTYTVSGPTRGQGSLLNTERTDVGGSWNMIHPSTAYGGVSINSWSSAQSIGFPFSFYGSPATHFCVSKNYLLTFDTTVAGTTVNSSITNDNTALPNVNLPDHTITYFWGGFSPPIGREDEVWRKIFGTAPNRQLWIQNFSYKFEAQDWSDNFVVLEETTHKIYVVDAQWENQRVGSYTVGVQLNSTIAIQHPNSPNISSINASSYTPWPNVDYYEFTLRSLANDDAGILSLDAPASPTVPGSQSVQVSIKNHGINNLDSVRVNWNVDGVIQNSHSHSWTGSLAPGAVAAAVNIGSYNFTLGNPTLKIWTSNPNGNPDNNTSNDTLEVSLFVCGLLGTYTLGGTSSDFPNFNSLATFLNNCGVSGPVIIKVAPGTYREQFTLGNIAGVSPTNTIVIDGGDNSLARLTHDGSTSNATVAFDSTSYVSLRNITLENTKSSTDAWVVHLQNTDHIVIDSCLIEQPVNATADRGGIVGSGSLTKASAITTNKHLTVSDNIITGGYYGIALEGNASDKDVGNYILRNRFIDIYNYGILVDEQDSLMISGNVIENINSSSRGAHDIYCQDITDFEITANNLLDCGYEGIVIYEGTSSGTARSLIANNMIYAPDAAIRMSGNSSNVNIYHNTAVGNSAMQFTGSNHSNMSLYNNIFSNPSGVALDASSILPSTIDIDYNLYQYQASGNIAEESSTSYANLAAWQAAKPALNQNSVEGNPLFVSATSPVDLHLIGTLANDTGDNSVGIKVDIDGDSRPLPPSTRVDIGADEYHLPTCLHSSGFSASVRSASAASLSWVTGGALNWNIEYGPPGFIPGSGTFVYNVLNPYILTGLNPHTNYDFYVQDSCGIGDVSIWRGPFSFATLCPSLSPATLPIVEGFEFGFSNSIFQQNQDVLCASIYKWSYETSLASDGRLRFAVPNFANNGSSAAILDKVLSGGSTVTNYLILTADLSSYSSSSILGLEFSYMHHGEESHANDRVWIRGSNTDAWVEIYDLHANQGRAAGIYNWVIGLDIDSTLANATPPQRVSSTFQVRFGQEDNYPATSRTGTDGRSFDDIAIRETCPSPTKLTATHITQTSATLSWVAGGASNWNIEWDTTGFAPGSGTFVYNVPNPYTVSSLTPGTDYDFYVRDSCGIDDVSSWSGPFTFQAPCVALRGAYTLGGATGSNNFPNFNSLATMLNSCGIKGPVIISVVPGTYREQFTLGNIAGVSQSNTIVIDGGDSSLITLTHDGSTSNATITFDSTSYVSLRNMTLENTKSLPNAWVVHLQNTDHIIIDSCLIMQPVNTRSGRGGILSSKNTLTNKVTMNKHLTVSDNTITGGYYGIYLNGNIHKNNKDVGNHILRNRFSNIEKTAIIVIEEDSLIISGNVIENTNSSFGHGMYCISITEFEITANNLLDCGGTGIEIFGGSSSRISRSLIANNMVYAMDRAIGISSSGTSPFLSSNVNIYHNTAVGNPAIKFIDSNSSNMSLYNNIFSSSHPRGVALDASLGLSSTIDIDYNLYQAGRGVAVDGSASYANLAAWQTAKPTLNQNSVEGNPLFVSAISPADLHVTGALANDTGDNSVGINVDIDDDPRPLPPSTRMDIGADEYHPASCLPSSDFAFLITGLWTTVLSWTAGGASNWVLEYGLRGFTLGNGIRVRTATNPHTLTALTPGTTYDFYVRDSCGSNNLSTWAGPYNFNTISCPTPSSLLATHITQNTATLSWATGGTSNWVLEYGLRGFTLGNGIRVRTATNPHTLTALTPGTTYDFYVRDSCGNNNLSTWAGPYNFNTISCPTPSSLRASHITQNTATLSWITGGASNWVLEYGLRGFTPRSGTFVYNVSNPYTLTGLTSGTTYDFYVRDSCGNNNLSTWASPYNFNTISCPTPSSLRASHITQNTATLSWATGGTSNWVLEYGLRGFTLGNGIRVRTATNPHTLTGLTPGTTYDFYVRDSCGNNNLSTWASPYNFNTISCPTPSSLLATRITQNTAMLSWITGGASNWVLEYGLRGFTPRSGTFVYNVSNPYTLTGLTSGTTYDFYVRDSCSSNNLSTWAGSYNFNTISCPTPSSLLAINITQNTATLSWATGGASNWVLEYGLRGFTLGNGIRVRTATNPHTLTGLTPGTTYDFYVRDSCGNNNLSTWAGPYNFNTISCPAPSSLLATHITQNTAMLSWITGGASNWNIEYGFSGFTLGSGTRISTTTPSYTVSGLTSGQSYQFYVRDSCGSNNLSTWAGPYNFNTISCPTPSSLRASHITQNTATLSWITGGASNWVLEYGLRGFTLGDGIRVRTATNPHTLTVLTPGTTYDFYVRDSCGNGNLSTWAGHYNFNTISCPAPSSLRASHITQTTATLSWITGGASNWELEYGFSGFTLGNGIRVRTATNPHTLTALTPGITYDFYVRDSCGSNNLSTWAGPYNFNTISCPTPSSLLATHITQNTAMLSWITGGASNWVLEYGLRGFTPRSGTFVYNVSNPYTLTGLTSGTTYDFYVRDSCGNNNLSTWAGPYNFNTISCPAPSSLLATHITQNTAMLSWITGGASNWNIEYGFSGFTLGSGTRISTTTPSYTVSGLTSGQSYQFYVRDSCGSNNLSTWAGPYNFNTISCPTPSSLRASHITQNTATLSWITGGASNWVLEYGLRGFTLGDGIRVRTATNPHTLTVLTPGTTYDFYVRDSCGNGNLSTWAGPYNFNTISCPAPSSLRASHITQTTATLSWITGGASNWELEYGFSGFTLGNGIRVRTATNPHTLTALTPGITYDFYVRDSCGSNNLSTWAGPYNFNTISCPTPSSLLATHITQNTAMLSWITGGASNWVLEYGLRGFTPRSGTFVYNVSNPYTLTGLTSGTTYDFYVRDSCGNNNLSTWAGPYNFNTISCPAPSSLLATHITQNTAMLSWITGGASNWNIEYGFSGFTLGSGTRISTTTPSYTVSGLTSGQSYQFYVRDSCGSNNLSTWAGPYNFNTISCPTPSSLRASHITQNTATLSWITGGASNWVLEYGLRGFTLGDGIRVRTATNPHTLTVLTPGTTYDFYVRDSCGNGNLSTWAGPYNFNTISCPAPSSLRASHITQTTATLSWITGGASNWELEYGFSGFTLGNGIRVRTATNPHTLTALTPGITYDFYVRDSCGSNNLSTWAGPYNFNTISCPTPSSLLATHITQNTAMLSWITGGASNWVLEYGLRGFTPRSGTFVYNVSNPYTLTGLTSGTTYDFYVRDSCGNNNLSTWAGPYNFNTISCPTPSSLLATRITQNTAMLSWITGGASNWVLEYGLRGFTPRSGTFVYNVSNPYTLTGLTSGTTYDFYVRDSCGNNNLSTWASPYNFNTISCPTPSSLRASHITQNTATLSWATGGTSNWVLEYGLRGFTLGNGIRVRTATNPHTLTGLTPGTTYDFYVRDSCGNNNLSTWASPYNFNTISCPTPSSLLATRITQNTAMLSWITGGASNWVLEYGLRGFTPRSGTFVYNVSNPYTLTGLTSGTTYDFYVRDSCSSNNLSTWAGSYNFNTISCPTPSSLLAINITQNTATLSWATGGASNWVLEYGLRGFTLGNGIRVRTATNPHTLTGLTPGTTYDFYVRDSCGNNNLSTWAGPYNFNTISCPAPSSLLATHITQNTAMLSWITGGASNWNIEYGFSGFTLGSGTRISTTTPSYTVSGLTSGQSYQFYVRDSCGSNNLSTWAGPYNFNTISCPTPSSLRASHITQNTATLSWITGGASNWVLEYGLRGFTLGDGIRVRTATNPHTLTVLTPGTTYDFYVRDSCGNGNLSTWAGPYNFNTISCPAPSSLRASHITQTTATLSWITGGASNWELEYGFSGFTLGNGIRVRTATNPHTLTALTPGITYDFYVRDSCGSNNLSTWAGPYNFNTISCPTPSSLLATHITQNTAMLSWITGGASNWVLEYGLRGFTPRSGTFVYNVSNPYTLTGLTSGTTYDFYVRDSCGNNNLSTWAGPYNFNTISCPTPSSLLATRITQNTAMLSWITGGASNWVLEYGLRGFTPRSGTFVYNVSNPYTLTGLTSGTTYDFYVRDSCGNNNLSTWASPYNFNTISCPTPSSLRASHITQNTATLSWATGGTSNWVLEYGLRGFTLGNGIRVRTATNPHTLTGLTPGTTYDFYVRDSCGNNNLSTWASPYNFNTISCPTPSSLLATRITQNTAMLSWITGGASNWVLEYGLRGFTPRSGTFVYNVSNPYTLTGLTSGTTYDFYVRDSCSSNNLSTWAGSYNFNTISCPTPSSLLAINITQNTATLSWATGGASNWVLEYGLRGFTLGNGIRVRTATNPHTLTGLTPGTTYDFYVRDSCGNNNLSTWAGPYNFNTISCPAPSSLLATHITQNTAMLSWITGGASNWNIEYGFSGFTLGSGTRISTTTPSYTVSGLTSGQSYQFYVRDSCGSNNLSTWAGPYNFNTISCPTPSSLRASHITQNTATLSWITGGASNWVLEYGLRGFTLGDGIRVRTATNPHTLTVLTPGTTYDFYVRDSCGNGNLSTWAGHYNFNTISCPAPSSLRASHITQTTATLSWITGGASNWELEYGFSGFTLGNGIRVRTATNPHTLTALTPGITYDFYVRDSCGSNNLSTWAGPYNFNTISCPTPSSLLATHITQNTAMLSWITGGASNWVLEYGLRGFTPRSGTFVYNVSNPYTLTGLTSGTTYDFYVRDSCGNNNLSTWAGPYNFNTISCPAPSSLLATHITQNTAMLSWITGGASNWNIEYGFSGFTLGSGTRISTTTPSYTVSGLTSGQSYQFYVRDSCGSNNLSTWAGPYNFNTISCPTPSSLRASHITQNTATLSWITGGASNWVLEYGLRGFTLGDGIRVRTATNPHTLTVLTPGTTYDFYVRDSCGNGNLSTWAGHYNFNTISCPAPSSLRASHITQTTATLSWITGGASNWELEYGFSGFTLGNGIRVRTATNPHTLTALTPGITYDFYVRDSCGSNNLSTWAGPYNFNTISCPTPSSLLATHITQNTAMLSWITGGASNWVLEYGLRGFTPRSGTFVYNVSNPYTLTGLTSGTTYDFYVRDSCGNNNLSTWAGPYNFNTISCPAPSSLLATHITQNTAMLSWITGGASNWNIEYGFSGFTLGSGTRISTTTPSYTVSGLTSGQSYQFYVRDSCGSNNLSTWAGPYNFNTISCPTPSSLRASHITQNTATLSWITGGASNWVLEYGLRGFTLGDGIRVRTATNPHTLTVLTPGTTYDFYVRDSCGNGNLSTWAGPYNFNTISCPAPSSLRASHITQTTATLSWITGGASNWELEYGFSGFTLGNGIRVRTATNPHTLTALTSGITYDFYVRDSCGSNNLSTWAGPYNFNTISCPTPSSLLATHITQNTAMLSWITGGASNWVLEYGLRGFTPRSGTFVYNVSNPYTLTGLTSGTTYDFYVRDSCGNNNLSTWAGPYNFNTISCPTPSSLLATRITQNTAMLSWITGGASNWVLEYGLRGFTLGNGIRVRTATSPHTLTALTSGITYDFYVRDSCGSNNLSTWAGPYNFNTISCPEPSSLRASHITQTTAMLSWITGGASNWELEYGLRGFAPGSGAFVYNVSNPYTLTALTSGITYDFYVRDSCGSNNLSTWTGPYNFNTISCPTPSSLLASLITQNTATLSWITGGASNWELEYGLRGFTLGNGTRISTTTPSYTVSGLTPGRSYQFYVRDSCGVGHVSSWAGPHTFRTLGCLAPTGLKLHTITEITATVSWTSGGASNWNIEYGPINFPLGSGIFLYNVSSPRTLRGLMPNIFYDIYVQDSCNVGNVSNWVGPLSIKTIIGIDELLERSFRIYPNPSEGVFKLEFSSSLGEDMEIRITNMMGQIVLEDEIESFSGSYRKRLEMGAYRSGVYLLQLITERATVNRRIILQ